MARTEHLSVYQAAYSLTREVFRLKAKLPKNLKHDLGELAGQTVLLIMRWIIVANGMSNKVQGLDRLILEVDTLRVVLRLLHDLNGISRGELEVISVKVREVVKEVGAWRRWAKAKGAKSEATQRA